ncbi:EamA family transporter [Streptomyces sp. NPDC055109]
MVAALGVIYLLWGTTYLAIRITVETLPPFFSAGIRFLSAAFFLATFVALRYGFSAIRITRSNFLATTAIGLLLLVGGNGLMVAAETCVPSGLSALLAAAVPMWMVLLRAVVGVRPKSWTLIGASIGSSSILTLVLISGFEGNIEPSGLVAVILATLFWSLGSFVSISAPLPTNPATASLYEMIAGGLGCLACSMFSGELSVAIFSETSLQSWLALAYLTIFGSIIAYTAYIWLLRNASPYLVSTHNYINPIVAVVLGGLILHETITSLFALIGSLILVGVCVIARSEY